MKRIPNTTVASVLARLRNSHMKDFYVVWTLSQTLNFDAATLSRAIQTTFERRQTPIPREPPPGFTAAFHGDPVHQLQWAAFVRRIGVGDLDNKFATVIAGVAAFLLAPARSAARNSHEAGQWPPQGPWWLS